MLIKPDPTLSILTFEKYHMNHSSSCVFNELEPLATWVTCFIITHTFAPICHNIVCVKIYIQANSIAITNRGWDSSMESEMASHFESELMHILLSFPSISGPFACMQTSVPLRDMDHMVFSSVSRGFRVGAWS